MQGKIHLRSAISSIAELVQDIQRRRDGISKFFLGEVSRIRYRPNNLNFFINVVYMRVSWALLSLLPLDI